MNRKKKTKQSARMEIWLEKFCRKLIEDEWLRIKIESRRSDWTIEDENNRMLTTSINDWSSVGDLSFDRCLPWKKKRWSIFIWKNLLLLLLHFHILIENLREERSIVEEGNCRRWLSTRFGWRWLDAFPAGVDESRWWTCWSLWNVLVITRAGRRRREVGSL